MSELTDLFERKADTLGLFALTAIYTEAQKLLPAHDAEIAAIERDRVASLMDEYLSIAPQSGLFHPLREKLEQVIVQAKREQMEADCRADCPWCSHGDAVYVDDLGLWFHRDGEDKTLCMAGGFRATWAEDHPEVRG